MGLRSVLAGGSGAGLASALKSISSPKLKFSSAALGAAGAVGTGGGGGGALGAGGGGGGGLAAGGSGAGADCPG